MCLFFFLSGQRDQEEVRKRNASICYSDPLYWERAGAAGKTTAGVNILRVHVGINGCHLRYTFALKQIFSKC